MLIVDEVTSSDALHAYWAEWSALVAGASHASFFESPEWLITWAEHFWSPRPLAFLFVRADNRLTGVVPLLRDDDGAACCPGSLTLPVHAHVPRSGAALADGACEDVLDACFAHLRRTRSHLRLGFSGLDTASPLWRELRSAAVRNRLMYAVNGAPVSVPLVRVKGDWETYLQTRSSHVRSELRRKRRNLEKAGRLTWKTVSGVESCAPAMHDVLTIEAESWKQPAQTALTNEPGVQPFYERLAERTARSGALRLHLLYLDSRPVAHIYGIVSKNEFLALKTSYDQHYRHLSPGAILFEFALHEAFDRGLAVFDLLGVEARWKRELATDVRTLGGACLFSRTSLRCPACVVIHSRLKPALKHRISTTRPARDVRQV